MIELPSGAVLLDGATSTGAPPVINVSGVPTPEVFQALEQQDRSLFAAMEGWVNNTRSPLSAWAETPGGASAKRAGGLFQRDRYVTPAKPYEQMRLAMVALQDDDVVAGVAETTESLAFSKVDFFAEDPDEEDLYNQIAARVDLDNRLREIWRELFTVSQVYVAVSWAQQTFKVRGKTKDGNARRKSFSIRAPKTITLLNPLKVVPVGNPYAQSYQGQDNLAYIADRAESDAFRDRPRGLDPVLDALITNPYKPVDRAEIAELQALGVDTANLWLLNPNNVFRHTATRPGYARLADVRMKGVFELLDMKHQLRQMERAHLIGGTNFIVLVTKGSDQHPALPAEISNLQAMVKTVARVPIMVGDHRLHVEIVTPKLDNTLRAERWNAIDSRITARLYQMFMLGNYAAGAAGDDSIKLVKVIARGMESRRHMIQRSLEKHIFRPLFEGNEELSGRAKLQFHPRSIALDFDAAYASFLFDLHQANDLSRETILNQFDLDQALEAELKQREEELYDDIFKTQVPFSTPNPANPANAVPPPADPNAPVQPPARKAAPAPPPGRRDNGGGRRNGGGAAPGTGQGKAPRRVGREQRSNAAVTIHIDGVDDPEALKAALRQALDELEDPDD